MYQAVFWPEYEDEAGNKVSWVGDVRSLLLDADGLMYEDSDHNGQLDTAVDQEIVFYYSNNVKRTRGCYDVDGYRKGPDGVEGTVDDYQCKGDLDPEREPCASDPTNSACAWVDQCTDADPCVETMDVEYLWSANQQLRDMEVLTDRKVYTWNDIDNNGMVDSDKGELIRLRAGTVDETDWSALNTATAAAGKRGKVTEDFLTSGDLGTFIGNSSKTQEEIELDAMRSLTKWLLGVDQDEKEVTETDADGNVVASWTARALRSRQYDFTGTGTGVTQEWRLGDVIHSAPTAVSKPAESYNQIYRDPTYADFAKYWDKRRIVIYFGANDGMLHAVNGGFYLDESKQFCCTAETKTETKTVAGNEVEYEVCVTSPVDGVCDTGNQFGEELWAYIPYNLQPHLKCLADEFYDHKYYVDLKPRIFDVQIFAEEPECRDQDGLLVTEPNADCIHPGGWGTILVGGMRFGGASVDAMTLNDFTDSVDGLADPRQFTSSFFILDITNPESTSPVLLGELTRNTDEILAYSEVPLDAGYCEEIKTCIIKEDPDLSDTPDLYADCKAKAICADNFVDLNYTTSSPAMVVMRDGDAGYASSEWYLVMGNGPLSMDGTNAKGEAARLAILPLKWLAGTLGLGEDWKDGIPTIQYNDKQPIRIPNALPDANEGGVYTVPLADNAGYVSDIISVDYNIEATSTDALGARYRTDAVYFGTADGTWHPEYPNDYYVKSGEQRYWNGGGRLLRLVTKVFGADGKEKASTPVDWTAAWDDGNPVRTLLDLKAPMVAAPSVGFDGDNYWIYAGAGRFYDELDKTDEGRCLPVTTACLEPGACTDNPACSSDPACTGTCEDRSNMAYFGVKEPVKDGTIDLGVFDGWSDSSLFTSADCYFDDDPYDKDDFDPVMTWEEISWNVDNWHITNGDVANVTDLPNTNLNPTGRPGQRGLMQTDNILVGNQTGYLACWHCYMDGDDFTCDNLDEAKCYAGVPADMNFPVDDPKFKGPIFDYDVGELDINGDPMGAYTFDKLIDYIAGTGCRETEDGKHLATGLDGWYHIFHDPRERNISTASLLGNMLYFTTYQPFNDKCKAEGQSFLYGLYYQTGTASADDVIGTLDPDLQDNNGTPTKEHDNPDPMQYDQHRLTMQGLVMPPTLHNGPEGLRAILTDASGKTSQQEVGDEDSIRSGRVNWSDQCN